jgi:hypothetical protein
MTEHRKCWSSRSLLGIARPFVDWQHQNSPQERVVPSLPRPRIAAEAVRFDPLRDREDFVLEVDFAA